MPSWTSGNRRALEDNVDRPGADYTSTTTADARACANVCAKDWRCFAFTWNKLNHVCHQKNEIPWPQANTDGISAMRDGLEVESSWAPGLSSDPLINLANDLPEECQAACAQRATCLSWSYFPPVPNLTGSNPLDNPPLGPATCRLNSVVGAASTAPSKGIGAAIARELHTRGHQVALLARGPEVVALADELGGIGGRARSAPADLGRASRGAGRLGQASRAAPDPRQRGAAGVCR